MSAGCGRLQTVCSLFRKDGLDGVKGESACGIVLPEKEAYNSSIGTKMGGSRI